MRKEVTGSQVAEAKHTEDVDWLDVERMARVEVTSEDPLFPIENAFISGAKAGWHAAETGKQTVKLIFDVPQKLHRIKVRFLDQRNERSQEFLLTCMMADGSRREIVRQQWSFSPGGSTEEVEVYKLAADSVAAVELMVDPDRGQNRFPATLAEFRVA